MSRDTPLLVCCDDRDACELLARVLEHDGWFVSRAHDLATAAQQLDTGSVGGLIIDLLVAGPADAIQLLELMRDGESPENFQAMPVLIAAPTDTNRLYAFQVGVDEYLVHPFHASELTAAVDGMTSRSPEERTAFRAEQLAAGAA